MTIDDRSNVEVKGEETHASSQYVTLSKAMANVRLLVYAIHNSSQVKPNVCKFVHTFEDNGLQHSPINFIDKVE